MSRWDICGLCAFLKPQEITDSRLTQEHSSYQRRAPCGCTVSNNFGFILHEVKTKFTFGNNFRKNKKSTDRYWWTIKKDQ